MSVYYVILNKLAPATALVALLLFPLFPQAQVAIASLDLSKGAVVSDTQDAFDITVTLNQRNCSGNPEVCYSTLVDLDFSGYACASGVLVPAGETSASQSCQMGFTNVAYDNQITATLNGTRSKTINVLPPMESFSVTPAAVLGGVENATATVVLGANAAGNRSVPLSCSPSGLNCATVSFVTGQRTSNVTLNSIAVSTDAEVTVTATYSNPYVGSQVLSSGVTVNAIGDPSIDQGPCNDCNGSAGSPINMTNGNTYIQQQDFSLPGIGGGLSLARTWNGLWQTSNPVALAGMFGHSWRSTYEEQIQSIGGNKYKYWRSNGSAIIYQYSVLNGTYTFLSPQNEQFYLSWQNGAFVVTALDGSKKVFNNNYKLAQLVDRNGNATTVNYDGNGRVSSVTDPGNQTLTFNYSGASTQVYTISDAVGVVATYSYDGSQRLTQVTYADTTYVTFNYDANNLITSVVDNLGKTLEAHTYDGSRRGLTSVRANGADSITVSYPDAHSAHLVDSRGNASDYTHALHNGRRFVTGISGSGCASCGGRGNSSYTLDTSGYPLSTTDALGHSTTFTYDIYGNVLTRTVRLDQSTTYTWTYTYNNRGQVLTATDPLGKTTTNTYDANGNLLTTTTPSPDGTTPGSTTTFTYDNKGQLATVTDPLNHTTTIAYTTKGLIQTVTDVQSNVTTFAYDLRGNRTSVTDARNKQTTFTYDSRNRLTRITYPDTTHTDFAYDNRGRRTSVTDANNRATTYAYDDADRLTSVTDAASHATAYAYDTENNLTSITDANSHATSFQYDNFGRVTRTTFPSTLYETAAYDAIGNLTSKTDRKGNATTYTYDALNRLTRKQYQDGSGVNYAYDALNRLTQASDATGTYGFTYDFMGRLTQTSTTYAFLTGRTFTVSYAYDAASNRTSLTDAESGVTTYAYDTLNRLTLLNNWLSQSFGFTYDVLGRRTALTRPNSVNTSYTYDDLSRLLSIVHARNGTTLDGAGYTYGSAGERASRTDLRTSTSANYGYDPTYQLTQVSGSESVTYTYDPVGNRLSAGGVTYQYNSSNQLLSTNNGYQWTYDTNGNTTSSTGSSMPWSHTWDFEDRLTVGLLMNFVSVNFTYDPFGRRIKKATATAATIYVYDGSTLIEETDGSGIVQARFTHGPNIDEPLAQLRSGTTSYYEADGLGSVTSLSTAAGALANTYSYKAFGDLISQSGSVTNWFKYTGREYEPNGNFYYYRARYYNQSIGRFISEDRIGFEGGENFYVYVWNNPAMLTDPFGLDPKKPSLWERFKDALRECWKDPFGCGGKPGSFGVGEAPLNLCNAGDVSLFHGSAPSNPHTQGTESNSIWTAQFNKDCAARATPDKPTYPMCSSSSVSYGGTTFFCHCCQAEKCKEKGK